MARLEALNLAKSYRGRRVIRDVSISMDSGEIVGLLGPNGAGKTTCFYMILGIVPADSGRILLGGEDITRLPMYGRARKGIGYLPQEASVFRRLTVAQNILAILQTRKTLSRQRMQEKLEELLQEFNLTHLSDARGIALSGGERRRVEIARALATDPASSAWRNRQSRQPRSASPTRGRWPAIRPSSCSTNPSPASTRYR